MTTETISYDFQASGIRDVGQAFQTVEQALIRIDRLERANAASAAAAARTRTTASKTEAKERQKGADDIAKSQADAEKKATAHVLAGVNERIRAQRREHETAARELDRYQREAQRAQREITRTVERESAQRTRAHEQEMRAQAAVRRRFAEAVSGRITSSVGNTVGSLARYGGMAIGLVSGLSVTDAVQSSMKAERSAALLANAMYIPGTTARGDVNQIMGFARVAEGKTGIDKGALLEGWTKYIEGSSDARAFAGKTPEERKAGQEMLIDMAQLAKGSGANFTDVMSAAGKLKSQNENMSSEQLSATMRNIVGQGKLGAVSMSDLATSASIITSMSSQLQGDQTAAQGALLGLSQISMKTSGTAPEAAIATRHFVSDTLEHQAKLRAVGINPTDKSGRMINMADLTGQLFAKTGGDYAKLQALGYGERGIKPLLALKSIFDEAEAATKGSGAAAVSREVRRFSNASYSKEDVSNDFKTVMSTNAEKFNAAQLHLRDSLEKNLTPTIEKLAARLPEIIPALDRLIDRLPRLLDEVVKLVDWFAQNPLKGVGAIIAAALVKDLAMAGIGAAAQKAITAAITAATGGSAVTGSASSALGSGGAASGAAGLGTLGLIAAGGAAAGASLYTQWGELQEWTASGRTEGKRLAGMMNSSDPNQRAEALAGYDAAKAQSGWVDTMGAYLQQASRATSVLNPLSLAGSYGSDAAAEGAGWKGQQQRSLETLRANEIVDTQELKRATTQALIEGIRAGVREASPADPDHPTRKFSQTHWMRGGTGNGDRR